MQRHAPASGAQECPAVGHCSYAADIEYMMVRSNDHGTSKAHRYEYDGRSNDYDRARPQLHMSNKALN